MEPDFFETDGDIVGLDQLEIAKVHDLAFMLDAGKIPFATLIECRKKGNLDTVVFEVEVEVPQLCRYPIRPSERIAATFHEADSTYPIVHALRKDFPQVPHLNLHIQEFPRNLCIYGERYEEIKRRWTSPRFVHQIRDWLALTARGELHQEDQPLEPILLDFIGHIVLPHCLQDADGSAKRLFVFKVRQEENRKLFLIATTTHHPEGATVSVLASVHHCQPQIHGVIHRRPVTLADLANLVEPAGLDLLGELRSRLREWHADDNTVLDLHLLLVILFPKKRFDNGDVETFDTWAFLVDNTSRKDACTDGLKIRDIGILIGLWDQQDNQVGLLLEPDMSKRGDDIDIGVLNVSFELTRSLAARLNGISMTDDARIVAVGIGALGSQTVMNLARGGFGNWTLIDYDHLMPHNVARHALSSHFVGRNKAEDIAFLANSIVGDANPFSFLPVDVLSPVEQSNAVTGALREADVILDMSTSIAVARKLVCDIESDARRVSLFLAPSGYDLVLIAEDKRRMIPLDALEMQYYRAVANDMALTGHFSSFEQRRRRYGQSCRDISSTLPQYLVALHAAIGSRSIREAIDIPGATLAVWRSDDSGNVGRVDVPARKVIQHQISSWTVLTDEGLLEKLLKFRGHKLPNETGGVLLGSFDIERQRLYIVDALPSPSDSEEWPTLYIRGRNGLRQAVEALEEKTHGMLEYIGEWHSHPPRARTAASCDDLKVFAWLTELMQADGLPGLMMIVGEPGRTSCYVGEIMREENLLPEASSHE